MKKKTRKMLRVKGVNLTHRSKNSMANTMRRGLRLMMEIWSAADPQAKASP